MLCQLIGHKSSLNCAHSYRSESQQRYVLPGVKLPGSLLLFKIFNTGIRSSIWQFDTINFQMEKGVSISRSKTITIMPFAPQSEIIRKSISVSSIHYSKSDRFDFAYKNL